jgi:type IV pilus assembly protein PilN
MTGEVPPQADNPTSEKRLRKSYALWCLALIGLCGIHRLYNRQPVSGFVWMATFGLCGVGQLADLFQMRKLVEGAAGAGEAPNRELASPLPTTAAPREQATADRSAPPLDLLRERRQQLEILPLSGVLEQRPGLIRRGLMIGGLLLGGAIGGNIMLLLTHQTLRSREAELKGIEQEVVQLRESNTRETNALQAMRASNDQLVKRLSDVRSSSALLADLQLRVPEGVQLTKVQMLGPADIQLEGLARDPMGFGRVNALELMLRRSPLFQATGVTIDKVERVPAKELDIRSAQGTAGGTTGPATKVALPSSLIFRIKASLAPLPPNQLVAVMESLKAEGMVRRLELLQREGLLK